MGTRVRPDVSLQLTAEAHSQNGVEGFLPCFLGQESIWDCADHCQGFLHTSRLVVLLWILAVDVLGCVSLQESSMLGHKELTKIAVGGDLEPY